MVERSPDDKPVRDLDLGGDGYWDGPVLAYREVSLMDTTVMTEPSGLSVEERSGSKGLMG